MPHAPESTTAPREQRRCPECGRILPSMDEKIDHIDDEHDTFQRASEGINVVLDHSVLVKAQNEEVVVEDLPGDLQLALRVGTEQDPLRASSDD